AFSCRVGLSGFQQELNRQVQAEQIQRSDPLSAGQQARLAKQLWREMGMVREDRIRIEFVRLTTRIGPGRCTAPKMLRHLFATTLQEGRVDPLIRNELMGHVASGERSAGHGLAMTAVYTHTRPETRRQQLEQALQPRVALEVARQRLLCQG